MKAFLIDLDRCNGCYCCQLACKDEHCGNDWSPIAKPQPMIGQFWCRVDEEERGRVPVVRVAYTPSFCGNCDECPLLEAAPECVSRNEYGFVVIDPDAARGRSDLADLCPHGFVFWNDDLAISQKCTGCAHLLQNGWNEPRCVDACSTGALRFIDEDGDADEIARASHAPGSHVYYLNVPKRWIAGTIVDRSIIFNSFQPMRQIPHIKMRTYFSGTANLLVKIFEKPPQCRMGSLPLVSNNIIKFKILQAIATAVCKNKFRMITIL